jgi:hypothetical protein
LIYFVVAVLVTLFAVSTLLFAPNFVLAQTFNQQINYQGKLTTPQ